MEGLAGEVTIRTQDEALPPGGASTGHNCSLCSVFGLLSQRQQGTKSSGAQLKGPPVSVRARTVQPQERQEEQ